MSHDKRGTDRGQVMPPQVKEYHVLPTTPKTLKQILLQRGECENVKNKCLLFSSAGCGTSVQQPSGNITTPTGWPLSVAVFCHTAECNSYNRDPQPARSKNLPLTLHRKSWLCPEVKNWKSQMSGTQPMMHTHIDLGTMVHTFRLCWPTRF